jgi:hypothetical protein
LYFAIGIGRTYGPKLLGEVELNIVLGNLLKDNEVGRESGRVSVVNHVRRRSEPLAQFALQYKGYSQRIHGDGVNFMSKYSKEEASRERRKTPTGTRSSQESSRKAALVIKERSTMAMEVLKRRQDGGCWGGFIISSIARPKESQRGVPLKMVGSGPCLGLATRPASLTLRIR